MRTAVAAFDPDGWPVHRLTDDELEACIERYRFVDREPSIERFRRPGREPVGLEPMWSPTPIVGYRAWVIKDDYVRGATGTPWYEPVMKAECKRRQGPAPTGAPHLAEERVCMGRCGINAFSTAEAFSDACRDLLERSLTGHPDHERILYGAVALSGKVVEHEDGYRAERAEVVGLGAFEASGLRATRNQFLIRRVFRSPHHPIDDWDIVQPFDRHRTVSRRFIEHVRRIGHAPGT